MIVLLLLGISGIEEFSESDCLEAVQLLRDDFAHQYHALASIILQIVELMRRPWMVQVNHIYREANTVVDFMAKIGVRRGLGWKLWLKALLDMDSYILRDELCSSVVS